MPLPATASSLGHPVPAFPAERSRSISEFMEARAKPSASVSRLMIGENTSKLRRCGLNTSPSSIDLSNYRQLAQLVVITSSENTSSIPATYSLRSLARCHPIGFESFLPPLSTNEATTLSSDHDDHDPSTKIGVVTNAVPIPAFRRGRTSLAWTRLPKPSEDWSLSDVPVS